MIGATLLHYRIVGKLGSGGMGEVFLAEDTTLERQVAVKILPRSLAVDTTRLERFQREARALAKLNHPNIVTVHAIERVDGVDFLVMEYIKGRTLAQYLPPGGLGMTDFFGAAVPLADALASAHAAGIVHRDLKPANIMVSERGEPKILDFGIAKLTGRGEGDPDTQLETDPLTKPDHIPGTSSYMAPEQLQGQDTDERSDIFSLGILLYQLATGRQPFAGDTSAEVVSSILRDNPAAADEIRDELPHHLGRIIRHCLEKDPEQRLQSAKDLRNEMADLQHELTVEQTARAARTPPAASREPSRRFSRRAVIAGGTLVATLAALSIWQLAPRSTMAPPPVSPEAQQLLDAAKLRETRGHTRENLEAAQDRYRRALALEPASGAIQARLAVVLARIHAQYPEEALVEEVRALATEAIERDDGGRALAHVALGSVLLVEGELQAAEREAEQAIQTAPDDYEGHGLLGRVLIEMQRVDAGLLALGEAVRLAGSDVRARVMRANALRNLGRNDEAVAEYVKIRQYDPDYPDALNNLAVIYTRMGRDLDAKPLFKRLLELDRRDDYAAQNLGVIHFNQGQYEDAVAYFELSHRLNPAKPTAAHALGETYEKLADLETARSWYATAVKAYDGAIAAGGRRSSNLGLRAFCVAKLGRFDEAKRNIAKALELDPDSGYLLFNAAQVHALAGESNETHRYVARSVKAGYPRQEFLRDAAFETYRDNPEFLALLEGTVG